MIQHLKSYLPVFFLVVFLFPALVKEAHSVIHHEENFHCDVQGETHLHIHNHDCTFCDFVPPVASTPSFFQTDFTSQLFAKFVFPHLTGVYFSASKFSAASLRAPPVLS